MTQDQSDKLKTLKQIVCEVTHLEIKRFDDTGTRKREVVYSRSIYCYFAKFEITGFTNKQLQKEVHISNSRITRNINNISKKIRNSPIILSDLTQIKRLWNKLDALL